MRYSCTVRTHLRILLAILAPVLLLTALSPARLHASPDSAADSDAASITTTLYPGWNIVGWVGPATPVSELFEAIPELTQVLAWDAEVGRYRLATPTRTDHGLSLTRGGGLWLEIGGDAAIEWNRAVSDEYVLLMLRTGWTLVGWTGEDGTSVEEALGRLGGALDAAARWDAEAGRYRVHHPGIQAVGDFSTVNHGDALWVHLGSTTRWAQPGTGRVVFEFDDEIPPDSRAEMREEMGRVMAFFGQRLGVHHGEITLSVSRTGGCASKPGFIKLNHPWCVAHEYFHILQFALAEGHQHGPTWLLEGSATYMEELYDDGLEFRRWVAPAAASHVASIRTPEAAPKGRLNYHLGFIAADWLRERAGEPALLDYYRQLPSSGSWEEAFATAFGLPLGEFYEAFEAHRAEVAPALPHLTDEVVKPVAVFLGDVPEETRATLQKEMDTVHDFLIERFGAEPAEYSVYFGATWGAVSQHARRLSANPWWDDRVRRYSLPLAWEPRCSRGFTGWMVHALDCERPLDHQSYINSYLRTLLVDKEQDSLSPMWIEAGGALYLGISFRSAGATDIDDGLVPSIRVVQQSNVPLEELAPTASFRPKGHWESGDSTEIGALSLLAVDWLLRRAGEGALFEYVRLLPGENTRLLDPQGWQPAFEKAFGLTVDSFYEQFEAYRATLPVP